MVDTVKILDGDSEEGGSEGNISWPNTMPCSSVFLLEKSNVGSGGVRLLKGTSLEAWGRCGTQCCMVQDIEIMFRVGETPYRGVQHRIVLYVIHPPPMRVPSFPIPTWSPPHHSPGRRFK